MKPNPSWRATAVVATVSFLTVLGLGYTWLWMVGL